MCETLVILSLAVTSVAASGDGIDSRLADAHPADVAKSRVEEITEGEHGYTVIQGGTMDGRNCRSLMGCGMSREGAFVQTWESNRSVRMENVGQTDIVGITAATNIQTVIVAGGIMLTFPSARVLRAHWILPFFKVPELAQGPRQSVAVLARLLLGAASKLVVRFLPAIAVMNSVDALFAMEPASQSRAANDWPQWRGPNRDGTVAGFSIPGVWPKSLDKQWSLDVGHGYSSPVVADGRVYQLSRQGDEEHVQCLELDSGKTVWRAGYPAAGAVHSAAASHGIGPKSTPVVAREKLYTLGIGNILSCFEAQTGKLLWRKTFEGRFSKPAPSCGASMSPLVEGELCIVHVGHDRDGAMYALDADTGEQRWAYHGDGPGYGSPIIVSLAGTRRIVAPVSRFVAVFDIDSGKVLWREPFPTHSTQNIITPLDHRNMIITGGIGQPTVALGLGQGEGAATMERVWENEAVQLHMSSPVLFESKLYGLSRMKAGHLFCLDANTGEALWQGEGRFAENAAILVVGNLLAILTSDGKLIFAEPTATGLDYLAEYPVDPSGRAWAHPALCGKRILVKGEENLICWSFP